MKYVELDTDNPERLCTYRYILHRWTYNRRQKRSELSCCPVFSVLRSRHLLCQKPSRIQGPASGSCFIGYHAVRDLSYSGEISVEVPAKRSLDPRCDAVPIRVLSSGRGGIRKQIYEVARGYRKKQPFLPSGKQYYYLCPQIIRLLPHQSGFCLGTVLGGHGNNPAP